MGVPTELNLLFTTQVFIHTWFWCCAYTLIRYQNFSCCLIKVNESFFLESLDLTIEWLTVSERWISWLKSIRFIFRIRWWTAMFVRLVFLDPLDIVFLHFDISLRLIFNWQRENLSVVLLRHISRNFSIVVENDSSWNQFSNRWFEEYFHSFTLFDRSWRLAHLK